MDSQKNWECPFCIVPNLPAVERYKIACHLLFLTGVFLQAIQ
jgi:hypothetical protein